MRAIVSFSLFTGALVAASCVAAAPADLKTLKAGDRAHGFRVTSVYLDANDRPLGARFMHRATGFQLDLLQIESVPQSFTWVKSFATGDQGEPHTQGTYSRGSEAGRSQVRPAVRARVVLR